MPLTAVIEVLYVCTGLKSVEDDIGHSGDIGEDEISESSIQGGEKGLLGHLVSDTAGGNCNPERDERGECENDLRSHTVSSCADGTTLSVNVQSPHCDP